MKEATNVNKHEVVRVFKCERKGVPFQTRPFRDALSMKHYVYQQEQLQEIRFNLALHCGRRLKVSSCEYLLKH